MKESRIVVDVSARIDWLNPPKNEAEAIIWVTLKILLMLVWLEKWQLRNLGSVLATACNY